MDNEDFAFKRCGMAHRERFEIMKKLFLEVLRETKRKGAVLEIGVHNGGSSLLWMTLMGKSNNLRHMITIDPYILYPTLYCETIMYLSRNAVDIGLQWMHYSVPDTMFFDSVFSILPEDQKKYAFCYLDGPHDHESVVREVEFFRDKMVPKGVMLIDDISLHSPTGKAAKQLCADFEIGKLPNQIWLRRKR